MIRFAPKEPDAHPTHGLKGRPTDISVAVFGFGLASIISVLVAPVTALAQTAAGTEIRAQVSVTYEGRDGTPYAAASDTLIMTVAQVAGVDVEPPRTITSDPGSVAVFSHTVLAILSVT